ncbi:hypothetical protein BBK36DRAFT_4467 [Trichoderma citrinoviride]|uniref:SnoaL-like domain-containing protein n=1 Tax=Trichoderma citrinoviride TaxID=58853 RepID=A0A2T4BA52_9HYPO|nr:hypothetical protein BBK36DRAFT_4467 [Trichoderma citrinoviride]PTB66213.1 hypothetical protein BBK36DRAFT_4467 [Trichoderma citrinoviride]
MAPTKPIETINEIYSAYTRLRPDSSAKDLEAFASFFSPSCKVYLRSMREAKEPAVDRANIIEHLRDILKDQFLEERDVISQSVSEDGKRVFVEMENRYNVHGQVLDRFPETLVATFDEEGLVSSFKLYSCRSHFVMMIQKATGEGPYSEEFLKSEH